MEGYNTPISVNVIAYISVAFETSTFLYRIIYALNALFSKSEPLYSVQPHLTVLDDSAAKVDILF